MQECQRKIISAQSGSLALQKNLHPPHHSDETIIVIMEMVPGIRLGRENQAARFLERMMISDFLGCGHLAAPISSRVIGSAADGDDLANCRMVHD